MRDITMNEIDHVAGGSLANYLGGVIGAVCGAVTRGAGGAAACAVVGTAVTDLANGLGQLDWSGAPDAGDYYNNMPAGMQ